MVRIIADSTCDLSQELKERYDISILPLFVILNDKEYRDGMDIHPDEVIAWSDENKTTPKTSAVSMTMAMDMIEPIVKAGDEVVVYTISGKMSTTCNVVRMAAEELEVEDKAFIVDTANLTTGVGNLAIEGAIAAKNGKSGKEIFEAAQVMKEKIRASFVVDTLEFLHRGGRCSSVAALAGSALKLHPRIVVKDGSMGADKKYRGKMESVIMNYTKDLEEELLKADPARVFITHSPCDAAIVNQVREYLQGLNYFEEILETDAGCVVCSHCGPGTLGVIYTTK